MKRKKLYNVEIHRKGFPSKVLTPNGELLDDVMELNESNCFTDREIAKKMVTAEIETWVDPDNVKFSIWEV